MPVPICSCYTYGLSVCKKTCSQAAELKAEIASLRQQLEAEKWKPIDTAPKDGTRIMIANAGGCWMAEYKPVYQSGFKPDNPWSSVMLNHYHIKEYFNAVPTHWMQLPNPPVVIAKEKTE